MDDGLPSISSGAVGSRFVSQSDIELAQAKRDEQWKAAYARLGQEPPPRPVEDVYDGRSLAEKLAANKAAKQEEWEEKTKLANQFRALEEDEVMFLDSLRDEEHRQELKRKQEDAKELKGFKEAVAAKSTLPEKPPISSTNANKSVTLSAPPKPSVPVTKRPIGAKAGLKGVIVKKKKTSTLPSNKEAKMKAPTIGQSTSDAKGDNDEGPSKKRRVAPPES